MLENLTLKLGQIVKTLRGQGRITEENISDALRDVRIALLEADCALPVVRDFIERVKEKAQGQEVLQALTPGQMLVGIVQRELASLMGEVTAELSLATQPPAVILFAGLQGSGKTTSCAKLSKLLAEQRKKKVLVVSCDIYRPAAIEQLRLMAEAAGVDFLPSVVTDTPEQIVTHALATARKRHFDVLCVDTAGRTSVDQAMMEEIQLIHRILKPIETLFVADAMLGQDAVHSARVFADALPLTGIILTKLDGDARGGAALSLRAITGKPIKFVGVGEKVAALETFHPERMAQRILGMGDIYGLVEHAERNLDIAKAQQLQRKLKSSQGLDLNDFKDQINQLRSMGGIGGLMEKLPAQFAAMADPGKIQGTGEVALRRSEAIIHSMTPDERTMPEIIKASRKRRIAAGAGVSVQEVNQLLAQFEQAQKVAKLFARGGMGKAVRALAGKGFAGKR